MFTDVDPADLEPREFAELLRRTPVAELRSAMAGPHRRTVLDGIFTRMPGLLRRDRAGTLAAVIHWCVGGRPDGGADTYELVVADGVCTLSDRPRHQPRLTLSLGAMELLDLIAGRSSPVSMLVLGRMKARGDMALTVRVPSLFEIPKP
ncbi:SCP2 sterol-binding domain-containing protein [Actinoplanes sp. N902-109]|uniref:SCP2 sterol-binding domain-containing protein n=1 Tax=Actinoplanes sp. (strain N902-109) TaxID=649831 RepID=UPI00032947EE|nr:SCP2 sterol-binding domain-containing protein [Actinoplanes sp. N902-109]AGL16699.1 sterol-binding domain-containing protein [Actinoplanes sp. N902-109]